jgi:signal transduction histidine kinase
MLMEIADTGPGIPVSEVDKIFDRFIRWTVQAPEILKEAASDYR